MGLVNCRANERPSAALPILLNDWLHIAISHLELGIFFVFVDGSIVREKAPVCCFPVQTLKSKV